MDTMQATINGLNEMLKFSNEYGDRVERRIGQAARSSKTLSKIETRSGISVSSLDCGEISQTPQLASSNHNTGSYKTNSSSAKYSRTSRPNKVRIISDVRIAPPTFSEPVVNTGKYYSDREEASTDNWIPVGKCGPKLSAKKQIKSARGNLPTPTGKANASAVSKINTKTEVIKRKAPKGSVVAITGRNEGFSYAEALKTAKDKISLDRLGIVSSRIRRAANGGILIEISGLIPDLRQIYWLIS